jgi:hypothetical protein
MNRLFYAAPIDPGSWLRIVGVGAIAFGAVELEKRIRFGGHPDEYAVREQPSPI